MKTDDKNNIPRVRIAVLGNMNVGKSGMFIYFSRFPIYVNKFPELHRTFPINFFTYRFSFEKYFYFFLLTLKI